MEAARARQGWGPRDPALPSVKRVAGRSPAGSRASQSLSLQPSVIGFWPLLLALALVVWAGRFRKLAPLALLVLLAGCSTGRLGPATPAGTYVLTVTASSGGAPVGSAQLTLIVQ